jgi:hypothetical protein
MTWFYRNPNETTFTDIALDLTSPPATDDHVADLFAVFLWRSAEKYGYRIPDSAGGGIVDRARRLLRPATSEDARALAAIRDPNGMTPELLDVSWMSFFATGDTRHLDRILKATQGISGENVINLVAGTAQWSFKSNCQQHPAILAYARERRRMPRNDEEATFLDDCIKFAEQR